jgi:nucleoside-triphosphatase THEP1
LLIIAITGGIGRGKTTLLTKLVQWHRERGKRVEGFLALAEGRKTDGKGAEGYHLQMVSDGRSLPFARRDESHNPPYVFDPETTDFLKRWAESAPASVPAALLVLDEFGPVEADGGGHLSMWPELRRSGPAVITIGLRDGLQHAIEHRLGEKFDIVLRADDPDALRKATDACAAHEDWVRVGVYGAGAGGIEASVGAALHTAQVPLRGLFLSSIQSVIMTYAADGLGRRGRVVWVPFVSASLKALSPSGNRFRPMLAIIVQGLLYGGAIAVTGWNAIGVALGGFLIGAWSALQGIALQYLFVGSDLVRAYDSIIRWVAEKLNVSLPGLVTLFSAWTLICGSIAAAVTLFAWSRRQRMPMKLTRLLERGSNRSAEVGGAIGWGNALYRGLRDLRRPYFWIPVAVVAAVILATGSPWESALWIIIRAGVLGFVLFSLARAFDPRRFIAWLRGKGHWGPALALQQALKVKKTEESIDDGH